MQLLGPLLSQGGRKLSFGRLFVLALAALALVLEGLLLASSHAFYLCCGWRCGDEWN